MAISEIGVSAIEDGGSKLNAATTEDAPSDSNPLEDLVQYVNPLQGTNSTGDYSRGATLPLVTRPFAMTNWSLCNKPGDGWYFDPNKFTIEGFRTTHQPSPWLGEYGAVTFLPQQGPPKLKSTERSAAYEPKDLEVHPDYVSVIFSESKVRLEATATERCAIMRFSYPGSSPGRVIIDGCSDVKIDVDSRTVTGLKRESRMGCPRGYAFYFIAVFDQPIANAYGTIDGVAHEKSIEESGQNVGAVLEFNAPAVVAKVATSFIGHAQASINMNHEIGQKTFDELRSESHAVWNDAIGAVRVKGATEKQLRTFYSCLYRTNIFPRMLHEYDAAGNTVHYSPFSDKMGTGPLYTDVGFWDCYRTIFPFGALIRPQRFADMVQGFLNAYNEGGRVPQWPSPGYHGAFGGTQSDTMITDAILKNIPGVDRDLAYQSLLKNATVPSSGMEDGRGSLSEYIKFGYIPMDKDRPAAGHALDYGLDDYCISLVCEVMGDKEQAAALRKRALVYRNIYNRETGFIWSKKSDGTWNEGFDPHLWGDPFTEGCAWQYTWAVPYDPAGLMEIMGGQQAYLRKLDATLYQPPTFHPRSWPGVIHEQREMAAVNFGQLAQGNQPVHHLLYMYAAGGCPSKTQYWTRRALDELYTPDQFPGDEDNGEQGAWYVLNALGFYPLCAGDGTYVFTSPLFKEAVIQVGNGRTLTIRSPKNSDENIYVTGIKVNGVPTSRLWVEHSTLAQGGVIEMTMAAAPVRQAIQPADLPRSMSPYTGIDPKMEPFKTEIKINCGGDAFDDHTGDCYFNGGEIARIAPSGQSKLFESGRKGQFEYALALPQLSDGRGYNLKLSFASEYAEAAMPSFTINDKAIKGKTTSRSDANVQITEVTFAGLKPSLGRKLVLKVATTAGQIACLCAIDVVSQDSNQPPETPSRSFS